MTVRIRAAVPTPDPIVAARRHEWQRREPLIAKAIAYRQSLIDAIQEEIGHLRDVRLTLLDKQIDSIPADAGEDPLRRHFAYQGGG